MVAQLNNSVSAPGVQVILPQTMAPAKQTKTTTARVQYDPVKMAALRQALQTPHSRMSGMEAFANALANMPETRSYTGGFGEEIISPWAEGTNAFLRAFGSTYGNRAAALREAREKAREDAIKNAEFENEAAKQNVTHETTLTDQKPGDTDDGTYRFTPDKIQELKDLNNKAGRWSTEWGAGMSDMANTESAQAWAEFEGKAKQYVQDQLKKIFGSQMTEQESSRFFGSLGLSRQTDPNVRWRLLENGLEDIARKNGVTIKQNNTQAVNDFMKGTI